MCCHGKFVTRWISYFASVDMNISLTYSVIFVLTVYLCLNFPTGILSPRLQAEIEYAFLISP
jgi:hypothetical protein